MDGAKISSQAVQKHLQLETCSGEPYCIERKTYDSVVKELENISNNLTGDAKIWVCIDACQKIRILLLLILEFSIVV